ncbi:hypothetical protein [Brevundimonas sp.]|uniref:hypothetical protein n=1 Tax=Brevundimonas sp. TaxID=1871086 RepID=UPI002FC6288A
MAADLYNHLVWFNKFIERLYSVSFSGISVEPVSLVFKGVQSNSFVFYPVMLDPEIKISHLHNLQGERFQESAASN